MMAKVPPILSELSLDPAILLIFGLSTASSIKEVAQETFAGVISSAALKIMKRQKQELTFYVG